MPSPSEAQAVPDTSLVALEKEYGISIASHEVDRSVFGSVASLARFIEGRLPESRTHPADGR